MSVAQDIELVVSQKSVSNCINEVSWAIAYKIAGKYIKFPTNSEIPRVRARFYQKTGMRGVVGCIDGTHVHIVAPSGSRYPENVYVNRKGEHSINIQLVCDSDSMITNVNAKFPGSTHDSFVWKASGLRGYNAKQFDSWLLGDSGYPLEPFLLTPYAENTANPTEQRFNVVHRRTRSVIERVNGQLKSRFRCLLKHRTLHYHPEKAANIIVSCCVLHNVCQIGNLPDEEASFGIDDEVPRSPAPQNIGDALLSQGKLIRDRVAAQL